jgi:hypothetical protein
MHTPWEWCKAISVHPRDRDSLRPAVRKALRSAGCAQTAGEGTSPFPEATTDPQADVPVTALGWRLLPPAGLSSVMRSMCWVSPRRSGCNQLYRPLQLATLISSPTCPPNPSGSSARSSAVRERHILW